MAAPTPEELKAAADKAVADKAIAEKAAAEKKAAEQAAADEKKANDAAMAAAKASGVFTIVLSPNAAPGGARLKVSGFGFGKEQGTSLVVLDGMSLVADHWSDTSFEVVVPAGARTGDFVVSVGNKQASARFVKV